jgi:hypothetical protein
MSTTSISRFNQVSIQVSKMSRHPAKLINETSWQIVNGEYDDAIVSLTHTLKTLKLVLSGDAKILIPSDEMNNAEDEDNDDNGHDQEYQDDDQGDYDICMDADDDDDADADTATDYDSRSPSLSSRTATRNTIPIPSSPPSSSSSSSSSSGGFKYDFFTPPSASSFLKTAVAVNGRHSIGNNNRYYINDTTANPHDTQDQQQQQQQHKLQVSIFRDPILVRGDHFHSPLDVGVCEQLSYVAIYNLALSHHLKSVQLSQEQEEEEQRQQQQQQEFPSSQYATASSSSFSSFSRTKRANENLRRVYLRKALSLYEHSHHILMKQSINVGVPVIHSMALVSNLGQIHHSLGDHHKAEMCMQYLLSTMMYVIDNDKVHTLGNSMDGFFNMILPLIAKDDPAAAA